MRHRFARNTIGYFFGWLAPSLLLITSSPYLSFDGAVMVCLLLAWALVSPLLWLNSVMNIELYQDWQRCALWQRLLMRYVFLYVPPPAHDVSKPPT